MPLVRLFIIFTLAAGDRVTYFLFVLAQVGGPIHWRWDEHRPFVWPRGRHGLSVRYAMDRKCRLPPFHLHPVGKLISYLRSLTVLAGAVPRRPPWLHLLQTPSHVRPPYTHVDRRPTVWNPADMRHLSARAG